MMGAEISQGFSDQAIEALAFSLGLDRQTGVKLRRQPQYHSAGKRFLWFPAGVGTGFQIKIDRFFKSRN
jgi:hypothetical protein